MLFVIRKGQSHKSILLPLSLFPSNIQKLEPGLQSSTLTAQPHLLADLAFLRIHLSAQFAGVWGFLEAFWDLYNIQNNTEKAFNWPFFYNVLCKKNTLFRYFIYYLIIIYNIILLYVIMYIIIDNKLDNKYKKLFIIV